MLIRGRPDASSDQKGSLWLCLFGDGWSLCPCRGCFCRQRETLELLVRCSLPLSQQIALQISTRILIRANYQESLGKRSCWRSLTLKTTKNQPPSPTTTEISCSKACELSSNSAEITCCKNSWMGTHKLLTVKCVSIGGSEIHVVNCLLYLSVLIYVCHPSSWDFAWKHFKFWSPSFSFLWLGFSRDLRKHLFNTCSLSVIFLRDTKQLRQQVWLPCITFSSVQEGASPQPGCAWWAHLHSNTVPYICKECAGFLGCAMAHGNNQIIS